MSMTIDTDVSVPMRDGVTLATDLWRPHGPGPWPVRPARIPYGKGFTAHLGNTKLPDGGVVASAAAGQAQVAVNRILV
ncbi:hypothetical protein ACWC9U_32150 [Streptomyces sp. 900116325]